uniref:Uncharacterized protein n=1 Tax=Arundo donax TaxID=35708 RepID=A0A0A9AM89_ARUDO
MPSCDPTPAPGDAGARPSRSQSPAPPLPLLPPLLLPLVPAAS